MYKPGKFRFTLHFPEGYPKKCPELTFISKVYHPLVDYDTGKLDLKVKRIFNHKALVFGS
jgi:ubiquitin-protein ligase